MLTKTVCSWNHEGTKDTKQEQGEVKRTGQLCNKGSKSCRHAQILETSSSIRAMFGNDWHPEICLRPTASGLQPTACAARLGRSLTTAPTVATINLRSWLRPRPRWVSCRIPSGESFFVTFVPSWFHKKVTLMFAASVASSLTNYADNLRSCLRWTDYCETRTVT